MVVTPSFSRQRTKSSAAFIEGPPGRSNRTTRHGRRTRRRPPSLKRYNAGTQPRGGGSIVDAINVRLRVFFLLLVAVVVAGTVGFTLTEHLDPVSYTHLRAHETDS